MPCPVSGNLPSEQHPAFQLHHNNHRAGGLRLQKPTSMA